VEEWRSGGVEEFGYNGGFGFIAWRFIGCLN